MHEMLVRNVMKKLPNEIMNECNLSFVDAIAFML